MGGVPNRRHRDLAPAPQEACTMQKLCARLIQDDGQTMAEYATVLSVITIACLTGLALLAAASTGALTRVATLLG
jgi:Flp pilus assembly pilin Flp